MIDYEPTSASGVLVSQAGRGQDVADPLAATIEVCRRWLTYQDPWNPKEIVGVKVAHYGMEVGGTGGEGLGIFLPAMREAQFHWAARRLPPLHQAAAFLRRTHPRTSDVTWRLWQGHRGAWVAFREFYPNRPLSALLDLCASMMAMTIGEDPL